MSDYAPSSCIQRKVASAIELVGDEEVKWGKKDALACLIGVEVHDDMPKEDLGYIPTINAASTTTLLTAAGICSYPVFIGMAGGWNSL